VSEHQAVSGVVLALDQGTTGSAALVVDATGRIRGHAEREIGQHYPRSGWVEHDPDEIFAATIEVGRMALATAGASAADVAAIGITDQRETTVVWERATGRPIHPAVVWQSRASAPVCERLKAEGLEPLVRERTGLRLDPYFSGTKIRWILDHIAGAQARAEKGELCFGTIDSWLLWGLTGGRAHRTDVTNASRTLLFDIARTGWDDELCARLGVPAAMLPEVLPSVAHFGDTDPAHFGGAIAIRGVAGDQQAALFGQACFAPGEAKNTYGTGCFLLVNTGSTIARSAAGLLATLAWDLGTGPVYALEGSAFVTGAAVQWLRDGLGLIGDAAETEAEALAAGERVDLYLVPAFTGLGAPYWDPYARGLLIGIERSTSRAHVVRATLESIAYQTCDLIEAARAAGVVVEELRADGGGTANRYLMQFQADIAGVPVALAAARETTALGAAYLAGLGAGVWGTPSAAARTRRAGERFVPRMDRAERESRYAGWSRAVERARGWATSDAGTSSG